MEELPNPSNLMIPGYVALLALEVALVRLGRVRGHYVARDTATSLAMGAGSLIPETLFAGASLALLLGAYQLRAFAWPLTAWSLAACFVLDDLRYYWSHRIQHRWRWGWAAHVIHHSSREFNLGTALRQTWTGPLTGLVVLQVPLALLGFHPAMIAFSASLNLVYQFWIHTEAIDKLPRWFEAVMNTPSHHRVHHGRNPRYLDANYAGTFIVWDRLFGSFVPEQAEEPVEYGILHDIGTYNPLRVAFDELLAIFRDVARPGLRLRERLGYAFEPPGWSHDGSRESSEDVKAAYVRAHPESAGAPGLPLLAA